MHPAVLAEGHPRQAGAPQDEQPGRKRCVQETSEQTLASTLQLLLLLLLPCSGACIGCHLLLNYWKTEPFDWPRNTESDVPAPGPSGAWPWGRGKGNTEAEGEGAPGKRWGWASELQEATGKAPGQSRVRPGSCCPYSCVLGRLMQGRFQMAGILRSDVAFSPHSRPIVRGLH